MSRIGVNTLIISITLFVVLMLILNCTNNDVKIVKIPTHTYEEFKSLFLDPILQVRVSGTPGNERVRTFIIQKLLTTGWEVTYDSFKQNTSVGEIEFVNIIATLNPNSTERIIFACHYDSKLFQNYDNENVFLGVSDSAVPCAMLIDMATTLTPLFNDYNGTKTLQFLFFDGEEAFHTWNEHDSLYGSKHLAELMETTSLQNQGYPNLTLLSSIKLFILLDLIADCNPNFYNYINDPRTLDTYNNIVKVERDLYMAGQLNYSSRVTNGGDPFYFQTYQSSMKFDVEDDHTPFINKNVPVLHFISLPFPEFWHTYQDNDSILCPTAITNLIKIFKTYIIKEFSLYD